MSLLHTPTYLPSYLHAYIQARELESWAAATTTPDHYEFAPENEYLTHPTYLPIYLPTVAHSEVLEQLIHPTYLPTYMHIHTGKGA